MRALAKTLDVLFVLFAMGGLFVALSFPEHGAFARNGWALAFFGAIRQAVD